MARPDIFPLKVIRPMAVLRFVGVPDSEECTRLLFGYLQENGTDIPFVLGEPAPAGVRNLILAMDQVAVEREEGILAVLRELARARELIVVKQAAMVRIFGPHFDIRPGLAAILFSSLSKAGINILASSTTITSTLLVVPDSQTDALLRLLRTIFRLPKRG